MIGNSLVGLLLFAASLGPGYVYVRVAEQRHPRVQRSALVEAVEMVSLGGAFSVLSALLVLALGDAFHALDASALGLDANAYLFDHPARVLGSLTVFLALSYLGALGAAKLVHRESEAVFKPARHVWQEVFWWNRSSPTHETLTLVELRDGRRVAGPLAAFTSELDENREIALKAPIYTSGLDGSMELLSDDFLTLREADVLYVSGRYRARSPAGPDS